MVKKSNIVRVKREVLEDKLLAKLDSGGCVAVLMDQEDLEMVIECMALVNDPKVAAMVADLVKLRDAAFGPRN